MMWWALQTVAVTGVMAALVAAVGRWGHVRPATMHVLWLLVVVRFVVPPVIEWPWSLTSILGTGSTVEGVNHAEPVPLLRLVGDVIAVAASPSVSAVASVPTGQATISWPSLTALEWMLACWVVTSTLVFVVQLVRLVRMHRALGDAVAAPEWVRDDVNAIAHRIGVAPPGVELSERLPVPVYWNVGRPRLIVPARLVEALDRVAWQGIFLHELAHHKRRDHWVGWLDLLAGCVWWWNPVFWYTRRRLREHAELACDTWVVDAFPERRREYAEALLHVFESVSRNSERLRWSMAADIRLGFERRLKMIYASEVSRGSSIVWLVCGIGLFVLVAPAWSLNRAAEPASRTQVAEAGGAEETAATSDVTSEMDEDLNAVVSIEFENEHIDRICGFLADYVDTNIILDHRVIEPAPRAVGQPLPGPSGDLPKAPESELPEPVRHVIPDPAYVSDGMVPYIKIKDVPLRSALDALCRPMDLAYETTPGFIWISSPKMIKAESWPLPQTGTASRYEEQATSSRISIEFEDEHISRIIGFVSHYLDINIMLDTRVVASAPGAKPSPDPSSVVTTGLVPYMKLNDVTLHQALLALLRPLNLAYRLERDFVWVSSPERLATESFSDAAPQQPATKAESSVDSEFIEEAGGEASVDLTLARIIQWTDGTYRAEIKAANKSGYFGVGEAFGRYEVRAIDPGSRTVRLFDDVEKTETVLSAEL